MLQSGIIFAMFFSMHGLSICSAAGYYLPGVTPVPFEHGETVSYNLLITSETNDLKFNEIFACFVYI